MAADNYLWFPTPAKGGLLQGKASQPEGESTDDWFSKMKAVQITNFTHTVSMAESQGSATTGMSVGKCKFDEFAVDKDVDNASAPLLAAMVAGAHFPDLFLIIRKPGGQNLLYLQFNFRLVFVTSITYSGGQGEENMKESVKFAFGGLGVQYIQQKPDGQEGLKMMGMWNTLTNEPKLDIPPLPGPLDYPKGSQA